MPLYNIKGKKKGLCQGFSRFIFGSRGFFNRLGMHRMMRMKRRFLIEGKMAR